MKTLWLETPKLSASLSLPDELADAFARNFSGALVEHPLTPAEHAYDVRPSVGGLTLSRNRVALADFPSADPLMFALEEDLENSLIARLGSWVGFHAGAVALDDLAIITLGHPDTGKTTTTVQLVELGLELLCEEVTPVDPATGAVHPFPGILTFSRSYAERYVELYPIRRGELSVHGTDMARYRAHQVRRRPVQAGVFVFPAYDPSCTPGLEELSPAEVLADVFQYCFQPTVSDEQLFDGVIRVIERCRVFRMRTRDIASANAVLVELIELLNRPGDSSATQSRR